MLELLMNLALLLLVFNFIGCMIVMVWVTYDEMLNFSWIKHPRKRERAMEQRYGAILTNAFIITVVIALVIIAIGFYRERTYKYTRDDGESDTYEITTREAASDASGYENINLGEYPPLPRQRLQTNNKGTNDETH